MSLDLKPVITATLAHRKASSSCCGAPLNACGQAEGCAWHCRACGQPCGRVLGPPQEVTATNG